MVKMSIHLFLILACITLIAELRAFPTDAVKAIGVGGAFGLILPAALGVASHFLEEKTSLRKAKWTREDHRSIELDKLLQVGAMTTICALNWAVLGNFMSNDISASLLLTSMYSYGQGRAFLKQDESRLNKVTSYLLPCAIVLLAYKRIPEIAPFMDLAGKFILVFGLAHTCGA
jgi:hypothetical protein